MIDTIVCKYLETISLIFNISILKFFIQSQKNNKSFMTLIALTSDSIGIVASNSVFVVMFAGHKRG